MGPECMSVQEIEQFVDQLHEIIEDDQVGAISSRRLAVSEVCK